MTPDVIQSQAALFDDPQRLLEIPDAEFRTMSLTLAKEAAPILRTIRRAMGLVAWRNRCKLPDSEYGRWEQGYAAVIGTSQRSLRRWRDDAVKAHHLDLPVTSRMRSEAKQSAILSSSAAPPALSPPPDLATSAMPAPDVLPAPVAEPRSHLVLPDYPTADDVARVVSWLTARGASYLAKVPPQQVAELGRMVRQAPREAPSGCQHPRESKLKWGVVCADCGSRLR